MDLLTTCRHAEARKARPLTDAQLAQARLLLFCGATAREHACSIYALSGHRVGGKLILPSPTVIARLVERGLAEKATRTERRRQLTLYWLTGAGIAVARSDRADAA